MNDRGATISAEAVAPADLAPAGGADLVSVFAGLRDELISTLWFVVGNRDDALDAAQEAFLKCWRARDSLAEVVNLRAWIFRVGMNAARDMKRSAWRRKARPLGGEGEDAMYVDLASPAPVEGAMHAEELHRLRGALIHLRDDEKEVFLLRQNGGLTYEQIADMRSTPIGTVKTQMRTALIKLRKVLAEV
jgi:RNA polymerase sigma factor (sigma-70 family)